MMRKCCAVAAMIFSCLSFTCGYALPSGEEVSVAISQIQLVDYIILIGGGIFLMGMLLILLSVYLGIKNKEDDSLYDDTDDADIYAEENETEDAQDSPEAAPEVNETEEAEEKAEVEEPVEARAEDVDEPIEVETESVVEENEAEVEDVAIPEEASKESVVRLTMTGTNNADVKIAEFSQSAKVGRRGTNDIMISDNAVSGEHCEFLYEDGVVYLKDLNSTNGTLLNGEVIEKEEIKTGDVIIIGKHQYKINISM